MQVSGREGGRVHAPVEAHPSQPTQQRSDERHHGSSHRREQGAGGQGPSAAWPGKDLPFKNTSPADALRCTII